MHDRTIARPFLPARDFALSKRFYDRLGFEKIFDGDVAIFAIGATSFILQNYFAQGWAENAMMQLVVEDLDRWWAHVESLHLRDDFTLAHHRAPAMQPWGMRVAYLADPSGVLWHMTEPRASES